jgi:hypothetical protein
MVDRVLLGRPAFALGKTGIMPQRLFGVVWPGVMACALLMAACGGSASPTAGTPSAAARAPAATVQPTPSPTADLYPTAKVAYLAAASAGNTAVNAANAALARATTAAQESAAYKKLAAADTSFRAAVFGLTFPTDMKADANALIGAISSEIAAFQSAASAADPLGSVPQGAITVANSAGSAAANVVRHDLGLPPIS